MHPSHLSRGASRRPGAPLALILLCTLASCAILPSSVDANLRGNAPGRRALTDNPACQTVNTIVSNNGMHDGLLLSGNDRTASKIYKTASGSRSIRFGDNRDNSVWASVVSFDTTGLVPEGFTLHGVALRFPTYDLSNDDPIADPSFKGGFLEVALSHQFSGDPELELNDFEASALYGSRVDPIYSPGSDFVIPLPTTMLPYVNREGLTQLRLKASDPSNGNFREDSIGFYSADASEELRPQLVVTLCTLGPLDVDGDGHDDDADNCKDVANADQVDSDGDGAGDACDACPSNPDKSVDAGACGCDVADTDSDSDGTPDCIDACPADSNKQVTAGDCGCGVSEADSDSDGTKDCVDVCPADPVKSASAGDCGCGVAEVDSDFDGVKDCNDGCPLDPAKSDPGTCGCFKAESAVDSDSDGTPDCIDQCPADPDKTEPGTCGCGVDDSTAGLDSDGDGVANCDDICPNDPDVTTKLPACGCGQPVVDTDDDGIPDCFDPCPDDDTLGCGEVIRRELTVTCDAGMHGAHNGFIVASEVDVGVQSCSLVLGSGYELRVGDDMFDRPTGFIASCDLSSAVLASDETVLGATLRLVLEGVVGSDILTAESWSTPGDDASKRLMVDAAPVFGPSRLLEPGDWAAAATVENVATDVTLSGGSDTVDITLSSLGMSAVQAAAGTEELQFRVKPTHPAGTNSDGVADFLGFYAGGGVKGKAPTVLITAERPAPCTALDTDRDGVNDCDDLCPYHTGLTAPTACGCVEECKFVGGVVPPAAPEIRYTGRILHDGDLRKFDMPGVAIALRFTGSSFISIDVYDEHSLSTNGPNLFSVFVDGVYSHDIRTKSQTRIVLPVIDGLEPANTYTVEIYKISEAHLVHSVPSGIVTLHGIHGDTTILLLAMPERPTRRLEFLGDSLVAGWGNECGYGLGDSVVFERSDNYEQWSSRLCRSLGAECHTVAFSGYGLFRDRQGTSAKVIPPLMKRTLISSPAEDWRFSDWIPHGIAISAGENDQCCGRTSGFEAGGEYAQTMLKLISDINTVYYPANPPHVFVLCGPMSSTYCTGAMSAVQMAHDAGFAKVTYFDFNAGSIGLSGCADHPNREENEQMKNMIAPVVKSKLGW